MNRGIRKHKKIKVDLKFLTVTREPADAPPWTLRGPLAIVNPSMALRGASVTHLDPSVDPLWILTWTLPYILRGSHLTLRGASVNPPLTPR